MTSISFIFFVFALCIFYQNVVVEADKNDGVLDKIKSGLRYAKNYLDTAKEIADLVSKSLGHRKASEKRGQLGDHGKKSAKDLETSNFISGFFRLLGLDSPRIAAIAVNSVIFLAQMISSLFNLKQNVEESRGRNDEVAFDPVKFIATNKNERIQKLVKQAQDPALPDQLIARVDGFDSACVRLLLCKTSPIILAAQNSLKNRTTIKKFDITSWLPTREAFEDNSDNCEDRHTDCTIFPELTRY